MTCHTKPRSNKMTSFKAIGMLFLLSLTYCSPKKHHKINHLDKIAAKATTKSLTPENPNTQATNGTKKQSLGMPFNNLDQQGLGGEPVGHIHDASEGVGGLGGDADGVPIGMGAGAEPLGMSKGKGSHGTEMSEHGGAIQGLSEESEGIRAGQEDVAHPFTVDEGGSPDISEGGKNMMEGQSHGFMPSSSGPNSLMMGAPSVMSGGPGGERITNGNFMQSPEDDEASYRGPKKDPLGGDIKPFNDEFKHDNGGNMIHQHGSGGMSHGLSPQEGMSNFSPMSEGESEGDHISNAVEQQMHHSKGMGENLSGLEKVSLKGEGDMGKFIESREPAEPTASFEDEQRGRRPNDVSIDVKGKPLIQVQKAMRGKDNELQLNSEVEKELSASQEENEQNFQSMKGTENRDMLSSYNFENPSTADISKALSGNPSDLNTVNIQGDSEVAEFVRKATHHREPFVPGEGGPGSMMNSGAPSTLLQGFSRSPFSSHGSRRNSGGRSKLAHTKHTVAHRKHPRAKQ